MRCKQANEMMSEWLDQRLDAPDIARLEAHLAECETCQQAWQAMQSVDSLLSDAAQTMVSPPVRMRVQVMARLSRRDRARRALLGGTTLTIGGVALALVSLSPVLMYAFQLIGLAPAIITGGPETLRQLITHWSTSVQTLLIVGRNLALPLALAGLCTLVVAVVANGVWIGSLRRARAAK